MGAVKVRVWNTSGSETLRTSLSSALDSDDPTVQSRGFRRVKDDRMLRHPFALVPACVLPPRTLLADQKGGGVLAALIE